MKFKKKFEPAVTLIGTLEQIEKGREILDVIFKQKEKPFWTLADGITQSLLGEFLACKERARLAYKEGWSSETTSNAITFGTLMHSVLESVYKTIRAGKKIDAPEYLTNTIAFYLQEFKDTLSKERFWTPEDQQTLELNSGYLYALVPAYFKLYGTKDAGRKYIAVEDEFKVAWENTFLRGKIDVVYDLNGETWILDHKTKSSFDDGSEDKLSFDLQGMFYMLAWKLKTGKLPSGFVLNMIKRPMLRQGKKENFKEFMDRVAGDVDETYFKRVQVTISEAEFNHWYVNEFFEMMKEFIPWAEGKAKSWRNPSSCSTRYGTCKMIRVCGLKDFTGLYQRKKTFPELGV